MGIYFLGMFAGKFLWVNSSKESKASDISKESKSNDETYDTNKNSKNKPIWTSDGFSGYRSCIRCVLRDDGPCDDHRLWDGRLSGDTTAKE